MIFEREIEDGIFQLSSDVYGMSAEFGKPTANSYMVIGDEKALLFDLAIEESGLHKFACELAGGETITVISHGHPDHIYHIEDFNEVYIHEADNSYPLYDKLNLPPHGKLPNMRFIQDGDVINLGNRALDVINIPGHTDGSVLLFDRITGTLLSGDTIARRLLYGLTGCPPLSDFRKRLKALSNLPIKRIYSAHDRSAIKPEYIQYMMEKIEADLPHTTRTWHMPGLPEMINLVISSDVRDDYIDIAVPKAALMRALC